MVVEEEEDLDISGTHIPTRKNSMCHLIYLFSILVIYSYEPKMCFLDV